MGESQDFPDEPEVRNAAGLPPIDTVVLRRQAGNIWASASGPGAGNANVIGAERDEGGANIEELGGAVVDVEGVEVNLVEAGVDAEYGEGGEGVVEVVHLPPRANARQAGERQVEVEEVILGEQHHVEVQNDDGQGEGAGLTDLATQVPPQLPPGADIPSLEQLHSTVVPTLKYCPKAARGDFARELATIWHRVTSQLDEERLWVLLGMFPRCILPAGRGPRAGDAYSQARLVRERLRRWRNGEYSQLWQEAVNLTKVPPKRRRRGRGGRQGEEKTQEMRNSERAKILAKKKSGGLRPIAVGNLLRRLVGKCCAAKVQDRAVGLLSPARCWSEGGM